MWIGAHLQGEERHEVVVDNDVSVQSIWGEVRRGFTDYSCHFEVSRADFQQKHEAWNFGAEGLQCVQVSKTWILNLRFLSRVHLLHYIYHLFCRCAIATQYNRWSATLVVTSALSGGSEKRKSSGSQNFPVKCLVINGNPRYLFLVTTLSAHRDLLV